MGLAGCSDILGGNGDGGGSGGPGDSGGPGGGGQDPEELGERVPTQTVQYYTGWYQKANAGEALEQQLPERLGLNVELAALDVATAVANMLGDTRESSLPMLYPGTTMDATNSFESYAANHAGSAPGPNVSHYTNCGYSVLVKEQRKIVDQEQRVEVLEHAQSTFSNDLAAINLGLPFDNTWAYRTDQLALDEDKIGAGTLFPTNTGLWTTLETVGDREFLEIASTQSHYYTDTNIYANEDQVGPWQNLIHSKLFYNDSTKDVPDFMNSDLAESVEASDDGLEYTVNLVDDATFHNGDPVTADDVKFSYEWLSSNPDAFLDAPPVELEVEAVDDTTAVFSLDEPYAQLVPREFHTWAILHRETWEDAGAWENPADARPAPEDLVGNGPFELTSFTPGQGLTMEPYTDHHHFDPDPDVRISMNLFTDQTSLFESIRGGDITAGLATPPQRQQIREQYSDEIAIAPGNSTAELFIAPQLSMAPTKFFEFREAIAHAINYEEIEALTTLGEQEPDLQAHFLPRFHPRRAPDEMLYEQANGKVGGDPEAAQRVLADAGWGWDDEGNLHYPQDADLSPRWEAGGVPDPENYPCIDGEGNYVRPPEDQVDLPIDIDEYIE
jgi:peptide/nickel transport system substrate-binding protein